MTACVLEYQTFPMCGNGSINRDSEDVVIYSANQHPLGTSGAAADSQGPKPGTNEEQLPTHPTLYEAGRWGMLW